MADKTILTAEQRATRRTALAHAVNESGAGTSADVIVRRAETYRAFLEGEPSPAR